MGVQQQTYIFDPIKGKSSYLKVNYKLTETVFMWTMNSLSWFPSIAVKLSGISGLNGSNFNSGVKRKLQCETVSGLITTRTFAFRLYFCVRFLSISPSVHYITLTLTLCLKAAFSLVINPLLSDFYAIKVIYS